MAAQRKPKTRIFKIAGPGGVVPELEHCPTIVHVDFSQAEFDAFLSNPPAVTRPLGLGTQPPTYVLLNGFAKKTKAKPRWCGHKTDEGGWIFYVH